ncbi:NAD(P)H-quinone oxidoreductase subunit T, chloroplastic [Salvia hispanica]|uniref:NAD(P)H-quinone oxidoreductase subunit T, chloroplastic n=1 Tax=Salvia hispanica TaxID=49212 RepID=UPI0020090ACE|nr:NAD(P)H-quinone oxidoreductase subunit T, chloroplastic [Salvia hispanica]
MAAPTATPPASFPLSPTNRITKSRIPHATQRGTRHVRRCTFRVQAVQGPTPSSEKRRQAPPGVDTRIHWESEDEGWIGGSSSQEQPKDEDDLLGEKFSELLNSSTDSYYQFLGVPANADVEEIKAAYRRLSKEYHPDTTVLPLRTASDKFMKLREIYNVLSDDEKRRFYDWTLAQEAASREAEKMRIKLDDPYMREVQQYESVPDMVDRLGGRNMELSDQATQALTFDILIILFSICCLIYVVYFKEPY